VLAGTRDDSRTLGEVGGLCISRSCVRAKVGQKEPLPESESCKHQGRVSDIHVARTRCVCTCFGVWTGLQRMLFCSGF
jgi:hypothetical protein